MRTNAVPKHTCKSSMISYAFLQRLDLIWRFPNRVHKRDLLSKRTSLPLPYEPSRHLNFIRRLRIFLICFSRHVLGIPFSFLGLFLSLLFLCTVDEFPRHLLPRGLLCLTTRIFGVSPHRVLCFDLHQLMGNMLFQEFTGLATKVVLYISWTWVK